jgi:ATP-dependent helicase/nuclease subunit A
MALDQTKARRNQLEFDDLLARTYQLLTDPAHKAIRKRLAKSTRLLMVDEFQDTNPLQVSIIQAFCGVDWHERGLFAVGDFKQSIYRFTGAEPGVSTDLRASLAPQGRLSLTHNFRSQPAITDFVNAVFHEAFAAYEPLVPTRRQLTKTPAVEFIWTPCDQDCDGEEQEGAEALAVKRKSRRRQGAAHDARVTEANWLARRLVQLIKSPEPMIAETVDGREQLRPLKLGDVAILLRSLSDVQVYEEALRNHGLDYYLAGGHAFYSQQEIYDILNLLRAVASEVDEIALAGALRSPLFSLADETLFWLVERRQSLNAALEADGPPPNLSAAEAAKVRRAAATMAQLRAEKDRLLVADLLALAMELTGYDAVLLTEFLGPRKAANLEKLIEQARALDRTSPGDLHGFITQLSEFVVRAPKEALAATQADEGVIRIMTIHYAKGLEFPLVVLPDLDRQRHGGSWDSVLDVHLGPLMPVDADEKPGCTGLDLYRHLENLEDLEERKRLFYVACTRAADYLILSSSIEDPAKPKRDWLQLVDESIDLTAGELRRPLPAGYGTPEVRVIAEKPRIDDEKVAAARGADLDRLVVKTRALAATQAGELPRGLDPIEADRRARRRFSFSQLTGMLQSSSEAVGEWLDQLSPETLIASRTMSEAQEFGALVHAVMERVDFREPSGVREWCEFLAPQFVGGDRERAATDAAEMIGRFLQSPRASELAAAKVVRPELEFVLPWPPGAGGPEGRYFHGYIDCLYQDAAGAWRLLDYKTNRVTAGNVPEMANRYELQMLVYVMACEAALGQPLAECAIQWLHSGKEHSFCWDAAERRRGVERLTAAIESLIGGA